MAFEESSVEDLEDGSRTEGRDRGKGAGVATRRQLSLDQIQSHGHGGVQPFQVGP